MYDTIPLFGVEAPIAAPGQILTELPGDKKAQSVSRDSGKVEAPTNFPDKLRP